MPLPRRRVVAVLLAAGLAALVTASAHPAGGAPTRIVLIGNDLAVQNGAKAPSIFTTTKPWHVVEVWTYHWNNGKGVAAGTIGLRDLGSGKTYGPWRAKRVNGVYWAAYVSLDLPPGRYRILDSSPATWAQNAGSGGRGMAWVMATPASSSPPRVETFAPGDVSTPGSRVGLEYSVRDDSGKARSEVRLYEGGTSLSSSRSRGLQPATGKRQVWNALLAADLTGPLFFCGWAENAAGTKSAKAPKSSCAWIPLLVDIDRVSNGCGGEGWETVVTAENLIGNSSTFKDSNVNPLAKSYTVSFVAACNLHDAGYAGVMVADAINGGTVDFRTWSRSRVDGKFLADMRLLCDRQIPATATTARANCRARGGLLSIGAKSRFDLVRTVGIAFFDADLTRPGTQKGGARRSA